ncbi:unnamed protein product [Phaeothamnion confervicola]
MRLSPYPIPEGLEENSAVVGKAPREQHVRTTITAFSAPKFRQIRAALVETDGPVQVLNLVMFPHLHYDLPIFGADLVSLPGGHLICIDLQPSALPPPLLASSSGGEGAHSSGALPWGGDLPEPARRFFSPHCLWSRPTSTETVETVAFAAMMDYLRHYLGMAAAAGEVTDPSRLAALLEGHKAYSAYRRVNDPARGMLTRFYGSDWTERAIETALFDLEMKLREGEYVPLVPAAAPSMVNNEREMDP